MIDRIAAAQARKRDREVQRSVHEMPPLSDAQVSRIAALLSLGPVAGTREAQR